MVSYVALTSHFLVLNFSVMERIINVTYFTYLTRNKQLLWDAQPKTGYCPLRAIDPERNKKAPP